MISLRLMQKDWIKTGIKGLDELLQGGVVEGSTFALVGPVGTLKSYIGYQFLCEGLRSNEKCVCINTNQDLDTLDFQMRVNFNYNMKQYVDIGLLRFVYYSPFLIEYHPPPLGELPTRPSDAGTIRDTIQKIEDDVTRILICTLSQFFTIIGDERPVIDLVYRLKAKAKRNRGVAVFILDSGVQSRSVEENVKSICDYVLETKEDQTLRKIRIVKALTKHNLEWHKLNLTSEGVQVEPLF
jgi:KaiC/GvpD/RAD55 family RecA-like ATPase